MIKGELKGKVVVDLSGKVNVYLLENGNGSSKEGNCPMSLTTMQKLSALGQSIWLDNINRLLIETGKIEELIGKGLRGMTSNPTIFDKAISESNNYDKKIAELCSKGKMAFEIYDELTVRDIQGATDMFRPLYEQTNGLDGYVSLEITPLLASKTEETIIEGERLYKKVNRKNLMLKVPATQAGFKAVEELLAKGMNVNVTLIFSLEQYVNTAEAYLKGLKKLAQKTDDLDKIASVASVFVSRVDTAVDKLLEEQSGKEDDEIKKEEMRLLKGKAAVANAKLIYQKYQEIFFSEEFKALQKKGAKAQRVLWASTGTKNPAYSDVKYITELIGKNTVNTVPDQTLEAFLHHGTVAEAITLNTGDAQRTICELKNFGIDVQYVCNRLLREGLTAFEKSYGSLLSSIEKKMEQVCLP